MLFLPYLLQRIDVKAFSCWGNSGRHVIITVILFRRSNGILPAKGPPQSSPNASASLLPSNNSSSRLHASGARNHPRNTFEQVSGPSTLNPIMSNTITSVP